MRYPNAAEVERVAENLMRKPMTITEISRVSGVPRRRTSKALRALMWQRRAVKIAGRGWRCRT